MLGKVQALSDEKALYTLKKHYELNLQTTSENKTNRY